MAKRESDLALKALTALRLLVAGLFAWAAIEAWRSGQPDGATLRLQIESALDQRSGPVRSWARLVLLRNPAALAFAWPIALLLAALGLALDLRRRAAAALGLVLVAHAHWFGDPAHTQAHLLLAALVVAFLYAKGDRH